jgi:hypothetical protein
MKREPRNGLRPVTAVLYGDKYVTGYFHMFCPEGSTEEGIGAFATIELEDGKVTQADAYRIKFEDVGE